MTTRRGSATRTEARRCDSCACHAPTAGHPADSAAGRCTAACGNAWTLRSSCGSHASSRQRPDAPARNTLSSWGWWSAGCRDAPSHYLAVGWHAVHHLLQQPCHRSTAARWCSGHSPSVMTLFSGQFFDFDGRIVPLQTLLRRRIVDGAMLYCYIYRCA